MVDQTHPVLDSGTLVLLKRIFMEVGGRNGENSTMVSILASHQAAPDSNLGVILDVAELID